MTRDAYRAALVAACSVNRAVGAMGCFYFSRVRRSASSSQLLTARRTSSRGGTPFGNSVLSSWLRSSWPFAVALLPLRASPARCLRVGALARLAARLRAVGLAVVGLAAAVAVLRRLRLDVARAPEAAFELPATPWTRRRCEPSAAGRLKLLPHSGQTYCSLVASLGFGSAMQGLPNFECDCA